MKILAVDVGSTFTKLMAIDAQKRAILGASKAFTTIETNVMEGYGNALSELKSKTGLTSFERVLVASSAAGGLKMVSVGLVPDLTAKASRLAAGSAGAKVVKTYSYELSNEETAEIEQIQPDIILLSGGIDGGNKDVIIKNAEALAQTAGDFAVIVAGNKTAAKRVSDTLKEGGKEVVVTENVMPVFGKLNVMPAKRAIRDLFIKNIISAKGLSELQREAFMEIVPTPLAVFNAAELLSRGTKTREGIGDLMLFDIGGATTDVYSMANGTPTKPNVVLHGLNEPFAKRTVEGDVGMRYSLSSLAAEAGIEAVAEAAGADCASVSAWIAACVKNPSAVPAVDTDESAIDDAIAACAIEISAERHAGTVEKTYTVAGELFLQTGKDLTAVKRVIGTGGQIINSKNPQKILERSAFSLKSPFSLKPESPDYYLDCEYCLSAMGLLGAVDADAALEMMKRELLKI